MNDDTSSWFLILAKSEKVKEKMKEEFSKRKIKKTYIAVVDLKMKNKLEKVECFLKKDKNKMYVKCLKKKGKYSLTYFERLKTKKNYSIVKCNPITGRTHQIRVHLLKLGHPILGDYKYCKT